METKLTQKFVIPMLLLILAYEWLVSFANKVFTKNYYQNLHNQLSQAISGVQLHFYASLLKHVGIPQYRLFGSLVLIGEAFVGLAFVIVAICVFRGISNGTISKLGAFASIIAAFMSLNYAILGGDTLFVDPANAFQEGISIDWVLFLVEVTFAIYFYSMTTGVRSRKFKNEHEAA